MFFWSEGIYCSPCCAFRAGPYVSKKFVDPTPFCDFQQPSTKAVFFIVDVLFWFAKGCYEFDNHEPFNLGHQIFFDTSWFWCWPPVRLDSKLTNSPEISEDVAYFLMLCFASYWELAQNLRTWRQPQLWSCLADFELCIIRCHGVEIFLPRTNRVFYVPFCLAQGTFQHYPRLLKMIVSSTFWVIFKGTFIVFSWWPVVG